jgi:hypothetical protein
MTEQKDDLAQGSGASLTRDRNILHKFTFDGAGGNEARQALDRLYAAATASLTPAECAPVLLGTTDPKALVHRLRDIVSNGTPFGHVMTEAANEIERLEFEYEERHAENNELFKRAVEAETKLAQARALVERADKILQSTGLQATVQEAILKHPHYSGSVTSAYGFAGAAIKAIRAALSSTVRTPEVKP